MRAKRVHGATTRRSALVVALGILLLSSSPPQMCPWGEAGGGDRGAALGGPRDRTRTEQPDSAGAADKVAYASSDDGDIWLVRPGTAQPRRLTTSGRAWGPAWSPDGEGILCVCNDSIQVIDAPTGRRTVLSPGDPWSDPAWSPNGRTVVFSRQQEVRVAAGRLERGPGGGIWAVDADGGNLRHLLRYWKPQTAPRWAKDVEFAEELGHFAFSPDGKLLGFLDEGEAAVLYVAELDEVGHPTAAQVIAQCEAPRVTDYCWLDDSRHLLVADGGSEGESGAGVYMLEAATGRTRVLLPHPYGVYAVAYAPSVGIAALNWRDGHPSPDVLGSGPKWTRDDLCLLEVSGRGVSGPMRRALWWEGTVGTLATFPGESIYRVRLGYGAATAYVLAGARLYAVSWRGDKTLLADLVDDFAVWSPPG